MVAFLKSQNLELKGFVAEEEEWVDDEESLDEEVNKDVCLMATTNDFVTNEYGNNSSTFAADLAKVASDSKFRTGIPHTCIRLKSL